MTRQSQRISIMSSVGLFAVLLACSNPVTFAAEADSGTVEGKSGGIESRGMSPAQSGAPGQPNAQLPAYPQKFEVKGPEVGSFGFAVTQPGSVVVDVQIQGAPVIVTLLGPVPQPISQQGAGPVRLTYNVTPQDIQKSLLWRVQIRLAQPAPPQQGGLATGMVNIQYPPVNQAVLEQAVRSRAKQRKEPTELELQQTAAQMGAKMEAAFQQHKAQFDRQQMDRRAAMLSQIQPQLDQLRGQMGGQVRPRSVEGGEGTPAEPGAATEGEIGTRALTMPQRPLKIIPLAPPAAPNPVIASVNVTQGQPGDPVMITGSGFGTGGEVHFVIAPGIDKIAPAAAIWSDTQIFTSVPDAAGVLGFNGTVYVKRVAENVNSNIVPFRFNPAMELRQITRIGESQLQQFNGVTVFNWQGYYVRRMHSFMFWGPQGNDHIFRNTRLKNGWVVSQPPAVFTSTFNDGGVYVAESHVGTDWPHLNVAFWVDCWASNMFEGGGTPTVDYSMSMVIQGPKGVPDGVVVP